VSRLDRWKQTIKRLQTETYAIYLASKDPKVPWYAKALIVFVVAHTFSPIDLIPDFIPVLGYLDDLIITPLGIALAIRMIPPPVLADCRHRAAVAMAGEKPVSLAGAVLVVATWLLLAAVAVAIWARR
jgi:uncharacterized membrane protein YkvA (DUF1232 family)